MPEPAHAEFIGSVGGLVSGLNAMRWKSEMVGCGRAGKIGGWTKEGMVRAKARRNRNHEPLSTTAAGNEIGFLGANELRVALAVCPNLHTLNLSGQWVASCLSWV